MVHKHSQGYFTLKNKIPHIFCLPVELPFYHSASFIGELEKNHTFLHLYSHSHIQSLLIYHRPKYSSKIIFFSHSENSFERKKIKILLLNALLFEVTSAKHYTKNPIELWNISYVSTCFFHRESLEEKGWMYLVYFCVWHYCHLYYFWLNVNTCINGL